MGEKLTPDLFTGTGNFTVPLAVPEGRNGVHPTLQLSYTTGQGNGPCGLGWSLGLPGVVRSTSHGLPAYDDARDRFVLAGLEDLVPLPAGQPGQPQRYRPRTEGSFASIEHIRTGTGEAREDFWQVVTQEGLTSCYGTPRAHLATGAADPAAVRNPEDPEQIAAWRLTRTADPFGNRVEYAWSRDRGADGPHRWDVPELAEIRYVDSLDPALPGWLVTLGFTWEERPDPFSDFRPGFEVRTRRRLAQVAVQVSGKPQKVFHLRYVQAANGLSLLAGIQVEGLDASGRSETLPPLTFTYSGFAPGERRFAPVRVPELPAGSLLSPGFELVDTTGKGLPDVLELAGARPRIWRNQGDGTFSLPREMKSAPAGLHLGDPGVQLLDADGNGQLDLMVVREGLAGVFPMRFGGGWDERAFRSFAVAPSFDLRDPEVRLLDLDGDGATDALRAGVDALECFFQDPDLGWNEVRRFPRTALDGFPNVPFSDPRVRFADMTGDGLQDLVLVQSGRVEYWPARGRGRWGRKIEMRGAPRLPERYDSRRLLLGDVDGDGCADLIYVEDRRATLWLNRAGQGFGEAVVIPGTPPVATEDAVRLIDLGGTGTAGLLWVTASPAAGRDHLFFLDLTGGSKPYLLTGLDNHLGAVTRVTYAPSTRFFVADERERASRWRAPLPFPVQVVARTETIDQVSGGRLTREFRYHHGYWDGAEREFRGFGRVDQRDSESFTAWRSAEGEDALATELFAPPTETRTWFHQGPQGDAFGAWHEADVSDEFWSEAPPVLARPAAVDELLARLPRRARRDALRALRGRVLRSETYALDGTARQGRPYTVTESVDGVSGLPGERPAEERLPADPGTLPADDWRLRVFFPYPVATRTSRWERGEEPRVSVHFVEEHDALGLPVAELAVALPRRRGEEPLLSLTERRHASNAAPYLAGRLVEETVRELLGSAGLSLPDILAETRRLRRGEASRLTAKLSTHERCYYDGDAFRGLPLGRLGRFGVLTRREELALDAGQLQAAFTGKGVEIPPFLLAGAKPAGWPQEHWDSLQDGAGYQRDGDLFFAETERRQYDFQVAGTSDPRGLVVAEQDPRGRIRRTEYDARYGFLPVKQTDPAGLTTEAFPNFHCLRLEKLIDPNGNGTRVTFTPLGLVEGSFRFGKTPQEGDQVKPGTRFEYDFTHLPLAVTARQRLYHDADDDPAIPAERKDEELAAVTFSDGFGRIVQTRTQAEPLGWGSGDLGEGPLEPDVEKPGGTAPITPVTDPERVVVSGFKRYDNKGQIVEAAEPYFDRGLAWTPPRRVGAVARTFYDALRRPVRTVFSDGSEERAVFGVPPERDGEPDLTDPGAFLPNPWEVYRYDTGDNAGRDAAGEAEARALGQAAREASAVYADTPASTELDALGREVRKVERLGREPADALVTLLKLDVQGNLLAQTDPQGRVAAEALYDHQRRPLWTRSLDAGARWAVPDAAGTAVWGRDGRGALELHAPDAAGRPQRTWARDRDGEAITLRTVIAYGDEGIPDEATRRAHRDKNLLGRPHLHHDEAGLVTWEAYDFHGQAARRTRRVIADAPLLAVFTGLPGPGGWEVLPYRVDWSRPGADLDLDPGVWAVETAFDALDRPKRLSYSGPPGTAGMVPTYNRAGLPERLELDGEPVLERIAYNARGQRIFWLTRTRGGAGRDLLTRCAYSASSFRRVRCRSEHCTVSGTAITPRGDTFQDTGYLYDRAGNLAQILERAPGCGTPVGNGSRPDALDRAFAYDALSRLTRATGRETDHLPPPPVPQDLLWDAAPHDDDPTRARVYTEAYDYDAVGFLLKLTRSAVGVADRHVRTFVPGTGNRLAAVELTAGATPVRVDYRFDVRGQMEQEGGSRHCEWDHAGRLLAFRDQTTAAAEPTVHAQYLVGAGGRRIKKLVRKKGSYEVTVSFDGVFEHRYEVQTAIGTKREGHVVHLLDGDRRILARRGGETFDGKPAELLVVDDHLGSSVAELDRATGLLVGREEFRPFGETGFGSYARKRYRFTGKERDEESGFCDHGARSYAPALGRWLSPDPAGPVDGLNLYAYVRNNPLRLTDPSGRQAASPPTQQLKITPEQQAAGKAADNMDPVEAQVAGTPIGTDAWKGFLQGRGFKAGDLRDNPAKREAFQKASPGETQPGQVSQRDGKSILRLGTTLCWNSEPAAVIASGEHMARGHPLPRISLDSDDKRPWSPSELLSLAVIDRIAVDLHERAHVRDINGYYSTTGGVCSPPGGTPRPNGYAIPVPPLQASEAAAHLEQALIYQEMLDLGQPGKAKNPWSEAVRADLQRNVDYHLKESIYYKDQGHFTWSGLVEKRQQESFPPGALEAFFGEKIAR
jgi:RHS repeat-associated protein